MALTPSEARSGRLWDVRLPTALGKDGAHPIGILYDAKVAFSLGQLVRETVPGASRMISESNREKQIVRERHLTKKKIAILKRVIRRQEPGISTEDLQNRIALFLQEPENGLELLGLGQLTRAIYGYRAKREHSARATPLYKIPELDMRPRMVCYYRKLPEFEACKEWLRSLIGREISDRPEPHGAVIDRPDLTNYASTETPHEAQRRVERLKDAKATNSVAATKAEQSAAREATALSDLTERYDLACMGEDQLEQLVRDGEITEEVADQIGLAVIFGDFREERLSR